MIQVLTVFSIFQLLTIQTDAHELNNYSCRPTLNSSEHARVLETISDLGLSRDEEGREKNTTAAWCPKAKALIDSIMDKLISSSNLERTAKLYPALSVWLGCKNWAIGDDFMKLGEIQISGALVLEMKSEDELAFVLAHELAHYSLGHDLEAFLDNPKATLGMSKEHDADEVGLELLSKAGYNSRASIALMKFFRRKFGDVDFSLIHGTPTERINDLEHELSLHSYPQERVSAARLIEAQQELRRLH